MAKHPAFIEGGEHAPAEPEKSVSDQPPSEEDLGAADICSLQDSLPNEDDHPLN